MGKLGILIEELQNLYNNKASEDKMVAISLEILSELTTPVAARNPTEKVSVIMPSFYVAEHHEEAIPAEIEEPISIIENEVVAPETTELIVEEPIIEEPVVVAELKVEEEEIVENGIPAIISMEEILEVKAETKVEATILPFSTTIKNIVTEFNEHHEIKEVFELKDTLTNEEETINDRLKEDHAEINLNIKQEPVKDIKRAFNINEKYVFINELFRGDDAMFERSLKTINAFEIYPEAQYWIQRELKVKLGWNESSSTVQHFDMLVKRRFAS